jgi:hypothetical protein
MSWPCSVKKTASCVRTPTLSSCGQQAELGQLAHRVRQQVDAHAHAA